jgi:hypothetical protein
MKVAISTLCMLVFATGAMGAPTYTKDSADFGGSLQKSVVAGDLLEQGFTTATAEQGSFYPGLGGVADLTDGTWGTGWGAGAAILRDYASSPPGVSGTPAVTMRYDFSIPQDIGDIRVYASNPDGYNGRSYHNYDILYQVDGDATVYTLLEQVHSTNFGQWNGSTEFVEKTATYVYDSAGGFLIEDCVSLWFKLYDTSQTTGGFWDPYDPSDPRDTDGNNAAFEGPGIREIDVLIPEPASLSLLLLGGLAVLRRR